MTNLKDIMRNRTTLVLKLGDLGATRNAALRRFEEQPTEEHAQAYREALATFQKRDAELQRATAEMVRMLAPETIEERLEAKAAVADVAEVAGPSLGQLSREDRREALFGKEGDDAA